MTGTPQCTASPTRRRAITSFRIVESGAPWYSSIQLVEAHRNIPRRTGFDNSEQSYSSAVSWARGKLVCSLLQSLNYP